MTPEEWWDRCTDPLTMLEHIGPTADARGLRLFACACARRVWHLLVDDRSKDAVVVAEDYAEGRTSGERRAAAWWAWARPGEPWARGAPWRAGNAAQAAWSAARSTVAESAAFAANRSARAAAWAVWTAEARDEYGAQASLLRCIFGNPFRPPRTSSAVGLGNHGGAARRLAESIYAGRRFGDLPVLADLLEEAGCTDAELLAHLRGPGPHALGCWALDALRGKS